jgi:hypothetical protein
METTSMKLKFLGRKLFAKLNIHDYAPNLVGNRILSCGEGEQLGHPGRNTTKKPRKIDTFPEGTKFIQVALDAFIISFSLLLLRSLPVECTLSSSRSMGRSTAVASTRRGPFQSRVSKQRAQRTHSLRSSSAKSSPSWERSVAVGICIIILFFPFSPFKWPPERASLQP